MKDGNKDNDRLDDLNNTLGSIENKLLYRSLERSREDAERAYDFINQMADADLCDIDCGDEVLQQDKDDEDSVGDGEE
jgi:hypothetical protein